MEHPYIDFRAILIAAIVNMIIGFVWYSRFLFGKEVDRVGKHKKMAFLWAFLVAIVTAYVLGFLEAFLGVTTVTDGMFVGLIAYLGFVATTQISALIWGKMTFKRFIIHTGCQLLSYISMGGIIGA